MTETQRSSGLPFCRPTCQLDLLHLTNISTGDGPPLLSSAGAGSEGDDDADAALDAEMTERLHFGGGFVRKAPGDGSAAEAAEAEGHKTKKEVWRKLILRSYCLAHGILP